jgi:ATP sulfurylase
VPPESSDTVEAVHRLKEEIDKLTLQQAKALRMATLVGMTPDEALEYDARRKLILKYVHDLAVLEESQ